MTIEIDIIFLTEEFAITPRKAGALVTDDPSAAQTLSEIEPRRQNQRDPLAKPPLPEPTFSDYFSGRRA